jgi:hypothetical protein
MIYVDQTPIDEYLNSRTLMMYKKHVEDWNTIYYYNGTVKLDSRIAAMGLLGAALLFIATRMRVMAYCKSQDQSADCKKACADAWAASYPILVVAALLWLGVCANSALPAMTVLAELIWTIVWIVMEMHFVAVVKAW